MCVADVRASVRAGHKFRNIGGPITHTPIKKGM